jgi:hypothetical protein
VQRWTAPISASKSWLDGDSINQLLQLLLGLAERVERNDAYAIERAARMSCNKLTKNLQTDSIPKELVRVIMRPIEPDDA